MHWKKTLQLCSHPLDMTLHDLSVLTNIYTDEISPVNSNLYKSVKIQNKQMKEFQEDLQDGFHATLPKKVITMENKKTKTQIVQVYNTELIYSYIMCIPNFIVRSVQL